jgi:hypothetical protein
MGAASKRGGGGLVVGFPPASSAGQAGSQAVREVRQRVDKKLLRKRVRAQQATTTAAERAAKEMCVAKGKANDERQTAWRAGEHGVNNKAWHSDGPHRPRQFFQTTEILLRITYTDYSSLGRQQSVR